MVTMTRTVYQYLTPIEDAKLAGWDGPGWYFWDETQSQCYGPYLTSGQAFAGLDLYIRQLEGPHAGSA